MNGLSPRKNDSDFSADLGVAIMNTRNGNHISRIDHIVGRTIMLSPYFDDTAVGLYNTTRFL